MKTSNVKTIASLLKSSSPANQPEAARIVNNCPWLSKPTTARGNRRRADELETVCKGLSIPDYKNYLRSLRNCAPAFNQIISTIKDPFVKQNLERLGITDIVDSIGIALVTEKSKKETLGTRPNDQSDLRTFVVDVCTQELKKRFNATCSEEQVKALKTVMGEFFDKMRGIYFQANKWTSLEMKRRCLIDSLYGDPLPERSRQRIYDSEGVADILFDTFSMEPKPNAN